ncbi:MAG TPA: hypothetical protein VF727_03730 [Allosphingosinicella sp.]|jgi:hypothetical protein
MRTRRFLTLLLALGVAGCGGNGKADQRASSAGPAAADETPMVKPPEPSTHWTLDTGPPGPALYFATSAAPELTLFCPRGSNALVVTVFSFRPIGSEERMSFGAGGTVVTLVADPRGRPAGGGVSASAPVRNEIASVLREPAAIAVNYGSQNAGPYAPPPRPMAERFLSGCGG